MIILGIYLILQGASILWINYELGKAPIMEDDENESNS